MAGRTDERLEEARAALAQRLAEDMARDGLSWASPWVHETPRNPVTGTRYRGRNWLLLTWDMVTRDLDDPRYMTYGQAKAAGAHVRRGAQSLPIERWRGFWRHFEGDSWERRGEPADAAEFVARSSDPEWRRDWCCVGHWSLFNACDIEGLEPYVVSGPRVESSELVDLLESASPCPVEERLGDEAYYAPSADRIVVPLRRQFARELDMAQVILHEQSHATGAPGRLDRPQAPRSDIAAYAREELVAELASVMVASELGLDVFGGSSEMPCGAWYDQRAAYLASWSKLFEDPASEVMAAAAQAGRACSWLMERCIEPELERGHAGDLAAQLGLAGAGRPRSELPARAARGEAR